MPHAAKELSTHERCLRSLALPHRLLGCLCERLAAAVTQLDQGGVGWEVRETAALVVDWTLEMFVRWCREAAELLDVGKMLSAWELVVRMRADGEGAVVGQSPHASTSLSVSRLGDGERDDASTAGDGSAVVRSQRLSCGRNLLLSDCLVLAGPGDGLPCQFAPQPAAHRGPHGQTRPGR